MKEKSEPKFGNGRRAADHLGIPYSLFRRGDFPYYVISKARLYKLSELESVMESRRVSTTSEVLR